MQVDVVVVVGAAVVVAKAVVDVAADVKDGAVVEVEVVVAQELGLLTCQLLMMDALLMAMQASTQMMLAMLAAMLLAGRTHSSFMMKPTIQSTHMISRAAMLSGKTTLT